MQCSAYDDAAGSLEELARSNAFVVSLDDHREWYRYHHLFGDLLRAELNRRHPELLPVYLRRAADWCERHGSPGEAFAYAHEAGDLAHAGRIALASRDEFASRGQIETLRLWLDRCTDTEIESDPQLSIAAAWFFGFLGDAARARQFLVAAEHGSPAFASSDGASLRSALSHLRSAMAPDGIPRMLRDAELAYANENKMGTECPLGTRCAMGAAYLLLGRQHEAISVLRESLALSKDRPDLAHTRVFALAYLVFAANDLGDRRDAQRWAVDAGWLAAQQHLHDTIYGAIALHGSGARAQPTWRPDRGRTAARERPAAPPAAPRGPMAQRRSRAALRRHQPRPRRRCGRRRTRADCGRRTTGISRCRNASGPVAASRRADQAGTGLRTHTRGAPAHRFPADASLAPRDRRPPPPRTPYRQDTRRFDLRQARRHRPIRRCRGHRAGRPRIDRSQGHDPGSRSRLASRCRIAVGRRVSGALGFVRG